MRLTLTTKVFFSLVLLSLFSVVLIVGIITFNLSSAYKEQLVASSAATAELISSMSSAALVFEQQDSAESILASLKGTDSIQHAALYYSNNQQHQLFASFGDADLSWRYQPKILTDFTDGWLHIVRPVHVDEVQLGWLHLQVSLQPLRSQLSDMYRATLIAVLATLIVAFVPAYLVTKSLLASLHQLKTTSTQITLTKNYGLRVHKDADDEIGQLVTAFNSMLDDIEGFIRANSAKQQQVVELNLGLERKVKERTEQLELSMEQLKNTLKDLKNTQRKMVEQEKLASLGSLVAGVAHEINTPVGVAVTMSTTFSEKLKSFLRNVSEGKLRRTDLDTFVQDSQEGLEILQNSLSKAATLIQSFKQVAVDQTSEERREFKLHHLLDELLRTLRHQLKNRDIQYQLVMTADVTMDSYPGPLGQVVTNLFNNAILHGFENIDGGTIEISAVQDNNSVILQVKDNGNGIDKALQSRIFEPFVTTKLGQGGSGLGLHIVHNIVLNILGGEITVTSEKNLGTCFTLTLPLIAPVKGQSQ